MIIVDSSVWIDHLRKTEPALQQLVETLQLRIHPFVLAEIALGNPPNRTRLLRNLSLLIEAPVASNDEVIVLVERQAIFGQGIGFVDVHLLASARLLPGGKIWTRDNRLRAAAARLGLAAEFD